MPLLLFRYAVAAELSFQDCSSVMGLPSYRLRFSRLAELRETMWQLACHTTRMSEAVAGSVRTVTNEPKVSTGVDNAVFAGWVINLTGISFLIFAVALTVRTYTRCPLLDEWNVLDQIARGAHISDWHWLWSTHNGHRIVITRLLVWLDLSAFGATNRSLLIEMYAAQIFHLLAICFVLERFAALPRSLKRAIEGIFTFSLFHPNQAQNLTWAFQVSFVLCFAIATWALLIVSFLEHIPKRRLHIVWLVLALAPLIASMNLAGGLLISPVVIGVALIKRVIRRILSLLITAYGLTTAIYLNGAGSTAHGNYHAGQILNYVLAYFDTSWSIFLPEQLHIPSLVSLAILMGYVITLGRRKVSNFEVFCLAECVFTIAIAALTAIVRIDQPLAISGRYQTPAMLYWASFLSLCVIWAWKYKPSAALFVESGISILVIANVVVLPAYWLSWTRDADHRNQACLSLMTDHFDGDSASALHPDARIIQSGRALLVSKWRRSSSRYAAHPATKGNQLSR